MTTSLVRDSNSDFRPLKTQPGSKITSVQESLLQECEKDIIWYRDNFFGKSKFILLIHIYIINH